MRPARPPIALVAAAVLAVGGLAAALPAAGSAGDTFGTGTPTFVNSPAPPDVQQHSGFATVDDAGEPSIGIDWTTGNGALYQAFTSTYKITFGSDISWTDVSSPFSQFNLDPILATNPATGTTLAGGDDGACAVMSRTTDDGETWLPSVPCPIAADHPTVGLASPTGDEEVAYFCQQPILTAAPDMCSYSHDGGVTWLPSAPDPEGTCHSLFGHVKISADGTAYIPDANCQDDAGNDVVGGLISTDGGASLQGYGIEGAPTPADGFDPSAATDNGNRVYESWSRDGDYHPVITWSDDHGATWAPQVDLANTVSPALSAATFESAVAGDAGRAAVAYLGTWKAGWDGKGKSKPDPFTEGFHGVWYLFVSFTYDGGATWQTVQATADPVQIGEIDAGGTTTGGQRNLLDFMDAAVTSDGRVVVAYADGCLNGPKGVYAEDSTCTTDEDSDHAWATVAYQSGGMGLFGDAVTPPTATAPGAPTLTASGGRDQVQLSWTTPTDGGSAITGYDIYRGTSSGGETLLQTVPPSTSYVDSDVSAGTTYYYEVAAKNDLGTGARSNETSAVPKHKGK